MNIKIIGKKITESELREIAKDFYGDMVKGVVDIERGIIAMGGEYHMDANMVIIENGSKQQNVWGINIKPDERGNEFIEFDSLINIKPNQNNRTRGVEDTIVKGKIVEIVNKLVHD